MKPIYIFIYVALFCPHFVRGQLQSFEQITNGSFEGSRDNTYPSARDQFGNHCATWELYKTHLGTDWIANPSVNGGLYAYFYPNGVERTDVITPSPGPYNCGWGPNNPYCPFDAFAIENNDPLLTLGQAGGKQKAATGNYFIGLSTKKQADKVGIVQKLSNVLQVGTYTFSVKVAVPSKWVQYKLEAFLSDDDEISSDDLELADVANVGGRWLDNKPQDQRPRADPGKWGTITVENVEIKEDGKYKFLIITTENCVTLLPQNTNNECADYFYLDDVSLYPSCTKGNECSPTLGKLDPQYINEIHDVGAPFCITGLDNVYFANLMIVDELGQQVRDLTGSIQGNSNGFVLKPNCTICWDGKTDGGAEAADAKYFLKVKLANDCHEYKEDHAFIKRNTSFDPTNAPGYAHHYIVNGVYRPPYPCCADDINITGSIMGCDALTKVVARKNVIIHECDIPSKNIFAGTPAPDNIIDFQAQNLVIDKMNVTRGSNVHLLPHTACTYVNRFSFAPVIVPLNTNTTLNKDTFTEINSIGGIANLQLFPNPASDIVTLRFDQYENGIIDIDVIDLNGAKIKSISSGKPYQIGNHIMYIPTIDLKNGMYFVQIKVKNYQLSKKLIISH